MKHKKSLFGGGFGQTASTPPPAGQPAAPAQYYAPSKQGLLSKLSSLAGLGNLLIFSYIFLGELFLPDHLRATTFLGMRLGGIQGETAIYAAPQQAAAASIVETAKADVEVNKTCQINLRESARSIYTQCMNKPTGSHPICNLEMQIYRDMHSCDPE